jgi:hypothetical protein
MTSTQKTTIYVVYEIHCLLQTLCKHDTDNAKITSRWVIANCKHSTSLNQRTLLVILESRTSPYMYPYLHLNMYICTGVSFRYNVSASCLCVSSNVWQCRMLIDHSTTYIYRSHLFPLPFMFNHNLIVAFSMKNLSIRPGSILDIHVGI